jgi:hypothetical protein
MGGRSGGPIRPLAVVLDGAAGVPHPDTHPGTTPSVPQRLRADH